ncbi:unnamed protein product [Medioppia subpectinata]|uniref:Alkyl transferase n=1 Tax=Medioppia subpectinata TaxID=1979941 RepID=A0A7R9Q042_9ACAR|nr:unnamed protein product [Medioppia subpectinata]CAG2107639.1 unnamed protein product [Medioppia subpectinata]
MSWFGERTKRSWLERVGINVVKCGPIPAHIAFIMDGNRRYAKRSNSPAIEGHKMGFNRLARTLDWCLDLGVREVTVFAFAVDNFRRPAGEVDGLMDFAGEICKRLLARRDRLNETGKCVRVLGDLTMLRPDIQRQAADIVLATRGNGGQHSLNICFAYSSRREIAAALGDLQRCVRRGVIDVADIDSRLIAQCLYAPECSAPDILVRTSGEHRLSDFLLWQTSHAVIEYVPVLWPEFTLWHLLAAVLAYQRNCWSTVGARQAIEGVDDVVDCEHREVRQQRVDNCLQYIHNKRVDQLKCMAGGGDTGEVDRVVH